MKIFRGFFSLIKWVLIVLILVEAFSFTVILVSNYILYGVAREGSRAFYDPYTLFLQDPKIRPTIGSRLSADESKNFVIWIFGGSTIRGDTDFDEQTIPSYLAQVLNSKNTSTNYSVVNFGINSFNSLMESKYLQKALIEIKPKPNLVIFYDGANDVKYFLEHRDPYGHHGFRKVKAIIESYHSSFFGLFKPLNAALYSSFTKELYDKINQVFIPVESETKLIKQLAEMSEERYDYLDKMVGCFGAKFLLIYQPMLWTETCSVSEAIKATERSHIVDSSKLNVMRSNFTAPYQILLEQLKNKPYFISYRNALCDRDQAAYKADGVHLTNYGRNVIAKKMADTIAPFLER
ncbi:MAG: hypothetical protein PHS86_07915 [Syntrophaceae bacterium]|nr:hypothetical protein [Syntrophaceae bacterium]